MKIILTQDVKNLGQMLAEDMRQRAFKMDKLRKDAEALAEKLNGSTINLAAKAGASGKIFGSVTSLQVANVLKEKGFDVDRRKIVFDDIKSIGTYEANINLFKDINATITLDVIAE